MKTKSPFTIPEEYLLENTWSYFITFTTSNKLKLPAGVRAMNAFFQFVRQRTSEPIKILWTLDKGDNGECVVQAMLDAELTAMKIRQILRTIIHFNHCEFYIKKYDPRVNAFSYFNSHINYSYDNSKLFVSVNNYNERDFTDWLVEPRLKGELGLIKKAG
jgi:hypothetical protein